MASVTKKSGLRDSTGTGASRRKRRNGKGPKQAKSGALRSAMEANNLRVVNDEGPLTAEEDIPLVEDLGDEWVPIAAAAEELDVSSSTVRRRIKSGELEGLLAFDTGRGTSKWMVQLPAMPTELEDEGIVVPIQMIELMRSEDEPVLVPIQAIDRLEEAWARARDAITRAEIAERVADFEKQRRLETEQERDRLREMLQAENEMAQRVADLERQRRMEAEKERDRLRALLEVEHDAKWWQKPWV